MDTESFPALNLHDKRIVSLAAYNNVCELLDALFMAMNVDELTRTERKAIERAYEKLYQFRHYRDQKLNNSWATVKLLEGSCS